MLCSRKKEGYSGWLLSELGGGRIPSNKGLQFGLERWWASFCMKGENFYSLWPLVIVWKYGKCWFFSEQSGVVLTIRCCEEFRLGGENGERVFVGRQRSPAELALRRKCGWSSLPCWGCVGYLHVSLCRAVMLFLTSSTASDLDVV